MSANLERVRGSARILLAGIRIFNGAVALFAPQLMADRFKDNPNSAVIYVLRLFGVRTIIIGIDLLLPDEEVRAHALHYAIPIHATDTVSAALAGKHGHLPKNVSIMLTALSGFNTILAILAQLCKDERGTR